MRTLSLLLFLIFVVTISCQTNSESQKAKWRQEIIETERAFSDMAGREGIPAAFFAFAADSVTVLRGNTLIKGKSALQKSYENRIANGTTLTWAPDFVDVSASGDLGYTYGKYVYTTTDSLGNKNSTEGIFHTVWKRQPDGTWKFVWD